jgi:hypothetical protein
MLRLTKESFVRFWVSLLCLFAGFFGVLYQASSLRSGAGKTHPLLYRVLWFLYIVFVWAFFVVATLWQLGLISYSEVLWLGAALLVIYVVWLVRPVKLPLVDSLTAKLHKHDSPKGSAISTVEEVRSSASRVSYLEAPVPFVVAFLFILLLAAHWGGSVARAQVAFTVLLPTSGPPLVALYSDGDLFVCAPLGKQTSTGHEVGRTFRLIDRSTLVRDGTLVQIKKVGPLQLVPESK